MKAVRGFTLLEGMLSLFFVSLLLGLFASLAHEFQAVLRQANSKSNTLTTLQVGLRQMLDEARQALPGSLTPAPGTSAVEMRLSRPSQDLSGWLPVSPPASPWTPPASFTRVRYYLDQGSLLREAGSPAAVQPLCQGVSDLQVQSRAAGPPTLEIILSQRETQRTVVLRGLVQVLRF